MKKDITLKHLIFTFIYILSIPCRYTWTWYQMKKKGRKLFIDNLDLVPWRPIYGNNIVLFLIL